MLTDDPVLQCADVTFKAEAESPGSDICFNSTDVGEAPFTYPSVPQAQTPDAGSGASLSSDSKGAIVAVIMAATFAGLLL